MNPMDDSTLKELHKAVLENPDEDTPRLAYADRLDEVGDDCEYHDRAAYIRNQIALFSLPPRPPNDPHVGGYVCERCAAVSDDPWHPRRCLACGSDYVRKLRQYDKEHPEAATLEATEAHIHRSYAGRFSHPCWKIDVSVLFGVYRTKWVRGFIGHVALHEMAFLTYAAQMFSAAPLTEIHLSDRHPTQRMWHSRRPWMAENASLIDSRLWDRLPRQGVSYTYPGGVFMYATEKDAKDDLSAACVRYGRDSTKRVVT